MKFVETHDQNQEKIEEQLFDKTGGKILNRKEKVFARELKNTSGFQQYYILTYKNLPYDPLGMYKNREQYLDTKIKKVSKDTFDFYMLFLNTKNSLYLTRAQRSFIND